MEPSLSEVFPQQNGGTNTTTPTVSIYGPSGELCSEDALRKATSQAIKKEPQPVKVLAEKQKKKKKEEESDAKSYQAKKMASITKAQVVAIPDRKKPPPSNGGTYTPTISPFAYNSKGEVRYWSARKSAERAAKKKKPTPVKKRTPQQEQKHQYYKDGKYKQKHGVDALHEKQFAEGRLPQKYHKMYYQRQKAKKEAMPVGSAVSPLSEVNGGTNATAPNPSTLIVPAERRNRNSKPKPEKVLTQKQKDKKDRDANNKIPKRKTPAQVAQAKSVSVAQPVASTPIVPSVSIIHIAL